MREAHENNSDSAVSRAREQIIEILEILRVGERLPGERELARRIGVARMTLRRAIEGLIADGFLERRPGSGTYARRPIVAAEFRLASFSDEMSRRGIRPGSRIISFRRSKSTQLMARKLDIHVGTEIFVCTRLRLADDQAIALETLAIPVELIPKLQESDFQESLYQALQKNYGVRVMEAKSTISSISVSKTNANLLGISQNKPCLQVDMIDKDQHGRVIMYARCIYRGDRYEVQLDATSRQSSSTLKALSPNLARGAS